VRLLRKIGPGSYRVAAEVIWWPFSVRVSGWKVIGRGRDMTLLAFLRQRPGRSGS